MTPRVTTKSVNRSHLKVPGTFQQTPDKHNYGDEEVLMKCRGMGADLTAADTVFSAAEVLGSRCLYFPDMMSDCPWAHYSGDRMEDIKRRRTWRQERHEACPVVQVGTMGLHGQR